jgi:DNA-binding NtrC family response regulator
LTENQNGTIRLLVVSGETADLRLLWPLDKSNGWHLEIVDSGWDAMDRVQSGAVPHLLVLDVPRSNSDGIHFLRWLRRLNRDLPVLLLCDRHNAAQTRDAVDLSEGEILTRPFDAKQLESAIRRQLAQKHGGEAKIVSNHIEPLGQDVSFIGASLIMQKLRAQAALMAKSDAPVLILGERGSGKLTVAALIHKLSVRSGFKLHRVNCAETPEAVLEAELFGDERVASNNGHARESGKLGGGEKLTIFLDEITALPCSLQSRLLQVLQNDESRSRNGGDSTADVRILAGSSANLDRALDEKRLREDLYYRLSAFTVSVPPLRQRKDEIATLLRYFMHKFAKHYSLPSRGFSFPVLDACQRYSWPGNLKELETFVKRYLVAGDEELDGIGLAAAETAENPIAPAMEREEFAAENRVSGKPESLKTLIQGIKSEAEQNAIGAALRRTGWNRKAAARLLKVSYRTLLYKIDQYHMRAPEPYLSPIPAGEFSLYDEVKGNGKAS